MKLVATLVLEDGTIVQGEGFGAEKEVFGEVVFNTSMTGYQEALTDPSYKGQILLLTYPLIGNYGVNDEDFESNRIQVEGFVVKEACPNPSHRISKKTIDEFLKEHDIPGISGVDTRALTIKIRKYGTMKGALATSSKEIDAEDLLERARKQKDISELDLVSLVTCKQAKKYGNGERVVLIDCGYKASILKNLLKRNLEVIVVPAFYDYEKILELEPRGIMVSNGPGDPKRASYVIETLKKLINEEIPIFGICLGNQLLALAFGADTYKLKFGHRGSNQPVKDLKTGKTYITSQNHGFAVSEESLPDFLEVSHINLNDNTVEGIRHKELPIFSVQYHPEANPGPRDSEYLFDEFVKLIRR